MRRWKRAKRSSSEPWSIMDSLRICKTYFRRQVDCRKSSSEEIFHVHHWRTWLWFHDTLLDSGKWSQEDPLRDNKAFTEKAAAQSWHDMRLLGGQEDGASKACPQQEPVGPRESLTCECANTFADRTAPQEKGGNNMPSQYRPVGVVSRIDEWSPRGAVTTVLSVSCIVASRPKVGCARVRHGTWQQSNFAKTGRQLTLVETVGALVWRHIQGLGEVCGTGRRSRAVIIRGGSGGSLSTGSPASSAPI